MSVCRLGGGELGTLPPQVIKHIHDLAYNSIVTIVNNEVLIVQVYVYNILYNIFLLIVTSHFFDDCEKNQAIITHMS